MKEGDAVRPWYQEPFVWLVISFPLSAVIAGIVTTYLAVVSYDGLVVDDYYRRGLEINKRIDRELNAEAYGLIGKAELLEDKFVVQMMHARPIHIPQKITAIVSHATKPGLDRTLLLSKDTDMRYSFAPIKLSAGRWYVDIGTDEWRVTTSLMVR